MSDGEEKRYFDEISKKGLDHGDYKDLFEFFNTRDWAGELNKSGHSIPDSKIESNDDDPPDVWAEMDGKRICVEVTRLMDEPTQKLKKQYEQIPEKQIVALWPRERFQECLMKAVQDKDSKMKGKYGTTGRVPSLHKQFLLLVTKELYLEEDDLAGYLTSENKVTVPRPNSFDAVYVMGKHVPNDGDSGLRRVFRPNLEYEAVGPNLGEGHFPVFEVSLS